LYFLLTDISIKHAKRFDVHNHLLFGCLLSVVVETEFAAYLNFTFGYPF